MTITDFFKRRSIRTNIMVSFFLLSILFMGGIGGISHLLVQRSGDQTITDSTAALEEQITANIAITAEKNAEIINEKLSSAQAMVDFLASELEYVFSDENRYGDRDVYYDLWFDNTTSLHSTHSPIDTHWDSDYQVDLSWDYSSYYYSHSDAADYDTLTLKQNQTLETVANMDYAFQNVHDNAPDFRWLYIVLPFDGAGIDLFINYPGSCVAGTDAERLAEPWIPSETEDWYTEVLAGDGDIVFTEPYFDPIDGIPLITIGRSVSFSNGTLIGVIFGDISIETMVDKILAVTVLETGYASLVTSSGSVVAHPELIIEEGEDEYPDISNVEANSDSTSALTSAQLTAIFSGVSGLLRYTRDAQERFLAYHPVGKGNYISLIILPVDEALAGIEPVEERMTAAVASTTTIIWIIAGASLAIGIAIGLTLTAYITKPFNHLIEVARSLSTRRARRDIMDGLMTAIDPKLLESEDELGELTRAFKGMIDSVQQAELEKNDD